MVELMDNVLVTAAVSVAIWYTIKYFLNLGKAPKGEPVSCGGCNSSCHSDATEVQSLDLLRNLK